ncbi:hypothetical protein [Parendozoicomonas haliclonae]|uniref:Uncharacterized protein n=1 Tax=Parendozoicomonas haliclonae TaxID=1960125 RepID=A0A1X7AR57_9GAMM|nr:hypothetical protein [Parendozoicomonas haliclonae]SMA50633.1 hypothetical protein EHSB41UT_04450 [Parendozoicomonas haliclonae]
MLSTSKGVPAISSKSQEQPEHLKPLQLSNTKTGKIPFALSDYFQLVDWAGRAVRDDKRGAISNDLPPILHRLGIDADAWLQTLKPGKSAFVHAIGGVGALQEYAVKLGKKMAAWYECGEEGLRGMILPLRINGGPFFCIFDVIFVVDRASDDSDTI